MSMLADHAACSPYFSRLVTESRVQLETGTDEEKRIAPGSLSTILSLV